MDDVLNMVIDSSQQYRYTVADDNFCTGRQPHLNETHVTISSAGHKWIKLWVKAVESLQV